MKNYSDKAGIQTARINVMHFCKNNKLNSKYTSLFKTKGNFTFNE